MSDRPTKVPAIATPTDVNLRDVARQIKAILDVREGVAGDPLDKVVTFRDLETYNQSVTSLIETSTGQSTSSSVSPIPTVIGSGAYDPTTDLTIPEAPEGFTVTGLFASVQLEWLAPRIKNYAYTEIWACDTDAIGSAVLIGSAPGTSYVDYLGSSTSRYYWARFVTQANITGPYNSTSGTIGTTAPDPGLLLESLANQITESQLFEDLSARIDLIDAPDTTPGSVAARIKTETDARVEGDEAVADSVTQLSATVGGNTTAIQEEARVRAGETGNLFAQYTVKIDANGYVSGFGLASTKVNDTPFSSFVIRADSFSISNPAGAGIAPITPFVVQTSQGTTADGAPIPVGVYMDGAFIKNATITSAKIGSVDADTIRAGYTSSVDLESSVFYGSELYLGGTATYEYNYPNQKTRKTGIASVSKPNIALTRSGANFDVNYFRITNGDNVFTPFEVADGVVRIQTAAIGDGTITTAKIADTISSTNYVAGQSGWKISKDGSIELQGAVVRGDVQATSLSAATGTFKGSLSAATGTFSGNLSSAGGTFSGLLSAAQISVGSAQSAVTFSDPDQPSVSLRSVATATFTYNGDTGANIYVPATCYGETGDYDCSYYIYSAAPVTSNDVLFTTNNDNTPINRRLRTGVVRFLVIASATVDHYFSTWYRVWTNGVAGQWTNISFAVEPQSKYGSVSANGVIELGLSLGQAVQFGMAAADTTMNFFNPGSREIRYGSLSVIAVNF